MARIRAVRDGAGAGGAPSHCRADGTVRDPTRAEASGRGVPLGLGRPGARRARMALSQLLDRGPHPRRPDVDTGSVGHAALQNRRAGNRPRGLVAGARVVAATSSRTYLPVEGGAKNGRHGQRWDPRLVIGKPSDLDIGTDIERSDWRSAADLEAGAVAAA